MYYFWIVVLAAMALIWTCQTLRMFYGMAQVPQLRNIPPVPASGGPFVSILFAARDEALQLPTALASQLAQDYPHYEVIAVNDRSRDTTPQILEQFASCDRRLAVVHIDELPRGWLGKPYALSRGFQQSKGDWLVFTDADVCFAPDLLRRTLALAEARGLDHLTVFPLLDAVGLWEKITVSYFVLAFVMAFEAWRVSNPRSRRFLGVGAFQLVRRAAYEAVGTHRRLAMEIAEDTKLGKLLKQAGFRSGLAFGDKEEKLRVRWQVGLTSLIQGLSKNFFSACSFSLPRVAVKLLQVIGLSLLPFPALIFLNGFPRALAAVAVFGALAAHFWVTRRLRMSPLLALTHPLGGLMTCFLFLHSTVMALWRGGVVWRDTLYPLAELRRGMV